jgi:hypothetical protein
VRLGAFGHIGSLQRTPAIGLLAVIVALNLITVWLHVRFTIGTTILTPYRNTIGRHSGVNLREVLRWHLWW